MNRFKPYLKAAAVVSTVALTGVLIAYRAGAFAAPAANAEPAPPAPEPSRPTGESPPPKPQPAPAEFLGGSKFAPVVRPGADAPVRPPLAPAP